MNNFFLGSIDLSKIDKKLIKMVDFKDGTTRPILQLTISKRKEPSRYGDTHYISIAPKGTPKEERSKYIIGDSVNGATILRNRLLRKLPHRLLLLLRRKRIYHSDYG